MKLASNILNSQGAGSNCLLSLRGMMMMHMMPRAATGPSDMMRM